jgi:two-component system osmolarity sensor histidine kinase EnvZ
MRLLPHSLLWRAFLLIALLMLTAVAAWLAIFRQAEVEPRAHLLAQTIVSVSNLMRSALIAARPERRIDLLAELSDVEGVHVYPAESDDRIEAPPPTELFRHLERDLRERLGPQTRLALALNGEPGLFVSFRLFPGDEGEFWLALPRERLERHFPWQWLGWGALVLLLALAGAWLIVLRIAKPLKALENAALQLGRHETPPPLPERGAEEIVAVTHAFNQMSRNLKQLEEDRRLLLAGISHDLRTPLTRLRMEIELSVPDAAARAAMESDIAEMDRTIGQFLEFARPPADMRAALEPTDLVALLAEIAERYGGKVTCRSASAEFLLPVQRESLRRAIVNLIENALHHAPSAAPVELELSAEAERCVIAVLDRGPGIRPEDAERLKQPFTRGESARSNASGAGLGLAIVERIAQAHGGRLELEARPGGGLAARIVLPLRAHRPVN